jgi:hypothetical protein
MLPELPGCPSIFHSEQGCTLKAGHYGEHIFRPSKEILAIENRMNFCFNCGTKLIPWQQDCTAFWCSNCCWVMRDVLTTYSVWGHVWGKSQSANPEESQPTKDSPEERQQIIERLDRIIELMTETMTEAGKMVDLIDYADYLSKLGASARARGKASGPDRPSRKAPTKTKA